MTSLHFARRDSDSRLPHRMYCGYLLMQVQPKRQFLPILITKHRVRSRTPNIPTNTAPTHQQPMPAVPARRKTHSKSRNGCLQCKKRHTKVSVFPCTITQIADHSQSATSTPVDIVTASLYSKHSTAIEKLKTSFR